MKLTVNQTNFAKALSLVSRAVNNKTTMPVLNNILLATDGDRLKLSATNREIAITCWIGASVEDDGAITVPARTISEYVNGLPGGEIISLKLTERTQTLSVKSGKFSANIKGISADDFPDVPTVTETMQSIAFDPDVLRSTIDRVAFAASSDENRPTLTGVHVEMRMTGVTMAATDGFRLSVATLPHDYSGDDVNYVIPAQSLAEVARMATDANSVTMHTGKQQLIFAAESGGLWQRCEVVTELIDAKFPDYTGTVPKQAETTITVDKNALLKATNVALLFARDNANIVRYRANGEKLTISAISAELGESTNEIDATIDGPEIEIAFNASFFREALPHFGDAVTIELTTPTRPGLMHSGDKDAFYHVAMPMHPPK